MSVETVHIILIILLSFILTYAVKYILIRWKVFDIPNERSSHDTPTPRGGGIVIVILWYSVLIYLFVSETIPKNFFWAMSAGVPIAIISFLDDIVGIKPYQRILAQMVSVLLVLFILNPVSGISFGLFHIESTLLLAVLAFIGGIWFINLFNFMDGIDAYASSEAVMVTIALLLMTGSLIPVYLMAICLGFLVWNWPKAKIFMGDIGSTQLGFILFVFAIYFHNNNDLDILYWLVLTSLFWFDATLTLLRRIRNRENISQAHRNHAYQRIVQSGFSHGKTVMIAVIINISYVLIVYFSSRYKIQPVLSLLLVIVICFVLYKLVDLRKPFPKTDKTDQL